MIPGSLKQNSAAPETVTIDTIARAHSVSKRTVTNWLKRRIIPAIRIGRVLRSDPAKVKAALEKFEQQEVTRERPVIPHQ